MAVFDEEEKDILRRLPDAVGDEATKLAGEMKAVKDIRLKLNSD